MADARYTLLGRVASRSENPYGNNPHPPWEVRYRLWYFTLTALRNGERLGGNAVQVVVGAPDMPRLRRNRAVLLWLASGWWVSPRNKFADAPEAAARIIRSVADELSSLTSRISANDASNEPAESDEDWALVEEVSALRLEATGPDHWRPREDR
jgi:hypothetical protein